MAEPNPQKDPAAARFWMLQLIRVAGALMVLAGLLIASERVSGPQVVGISLLLIGMGAFFWLPRNLARRWKSPPP